MGARAVVGPGRADRADRADRWRLPREALILAATLVLFARIHAAGHDVVLATSNAQRLQAVELVLRLDLELAANRWLVDRPGLAVAAVACYRLYYAVLAGVVLWIAVRRPGSYRRARRVLVTLAGIALLVYWAVPMSPPRFALPGIVDVVASTDILGWRAVGSDRGGNQYSAMPSMHVGWSAWAAYALWSALRDSHPHTRWAAWLFPALMVGAVIGTGNHYVLDVVGSAVALGTAILAVTAWERWARQRAGVLNSSPT